MRKTRKHPVYTIEEKNEIVRQYLENDIQTKDLLAHYDIHKTQLYRWRDQVLEHGTTVDGRGKNAKNPGRPKRIKVDEMTREELLQYVKAMEDVKKTVAYLRKQKKNIKQ